mmetsp:Transcript_53707/g.112072  ORF Transcript_53707/g.112072 Transcript_53707/m.112072 type:complete len:258 (+) Transcript_53707:301-1074(+)
MLGVGPRGIEERQHPQHTPLAVLLIHSGHCQRSNPTGAQFMHLVFDSVANLVLVVAKAQDHMRCPLGNAKYFAVRVLQSALRALGAGVEGGEFQLFEGVETIQCGVTLRIRILIIGLGQLQSRLEHHRVQRVTWRLLPLSRECCLKHDRVFCLIGTEGRTVILYDHLVEGERARLVRAEHVHPRHRLDRRQPRHDRPVPGEDAGAGGEGGGGDDFDGDGDGGYEEDYREGKALLDDGGVGLGRVGRHQGQPLALVGT